MSDLREQLAKRLQDVACEVHTGDLGGADINHPDVGLAVADECLRQMEWVRRDRLNEGRLEALINHAGAGLVGQEIEREAIGAYSAVVFCPLTLAPDDWTPEKDA